MKLVRLTLENIKSYSAETIDFFDGVNFISGANGAGKTTIIEAIGYAIFDSNPFASQKQFIRQGKKSGTITVLIEAADERLYRIVRRLREPSGSSWAVYDEESGQELNELHGNQDVRAWLKTNLGLGSGLDSMSLFEDVIGISQGKFITPFMERPKERKKIFNSILQLESYREAFDKSSVLVNLLKDRTTQKENEKNVLLVKTEDLEECRKKLLENQEIADSYSRRKQELTAELVALMLEIQKQEQLRNDMEKNQKLQHGLEVSIATMKSRQESLTVQIKETEHSKKTVEQTESSFRQYEQQKLIKNELTAQRSARDMLNVKMQEKKQQHLSLEVEIRGEKINRNQQIEQWELEQQETKREGEILSGEKEELTNELIWSKKWQAKSDELKARFALLQQMLINMERNKVIVQAKMDSYRLLDTEENGVRAQLQEWLKKEKLALSITKVEQEYNKLRENLSHQENRQTVLQENYQASAGGMCPFLEKECLNVTGNLQQHFQTEIDQLTKDIEETSLAEAQAKQKLLFIRQACEDYRILQHQKIQLDRIIAQKEDLAVLIKEEYQKLSVELRPEQIQELKEGLLLYDDASLRIEAGISEGTILQNGELKGLLEGYRETYRAVFGIAGQDYEENSLKKLQEWLAQCKKSVELFWTSLDNELLQHRQQKNGRYAAVESRLNTLRETYRKLAERLKALQEDTTIVAKEKELQDKEADMQFLINELQSYIALDQKIKDNQESLARYEPDYLKYVQNIENVRKYQLLNSEILTNTAALKEYLLQQENIFRVGKQLEEGYKAEQLLEMRGASEAKSEEKGRVENALSHAQQEVEHYSILLREKEETRQKISALETEIDREYKAQELLRLLRTTFNRSGEEIADIYRQHLGREANLIYQQIARENVNLIWSDDYELIVRDSRDGSDSGRVFSQLSGGEKMTAALSIRLALLKYLSGLGIGFFDEPTANLDETRRGNLARMIPQVMGDFRQLFVISHDDSFDAITENIIHLQKDAQGTRVIS